MDELIAAAAEAMKVPAEMVERSAAARAEADGVAVEDVLRAWAGGGEIIPSTQPAEPEAPAVEESPPEEPAGEPAAAATPAPAPAAPTGTDEASLITAASQKMGMPESMIKRSATARAKAAGTDFMSVLRDWAGTDPADPLPPQAPDRAGAVTTPPEPADATPGPSVDPDEPVPEAEPPAEEPATPAPVAPAALDEDALVAAAAEKTGMPEAMVKRSAEARAKATGSDLTSVLAEWAGEEIAAAPEAPAAEAAEELAPADDAAPAPAAEEPAEDVEEPEEEPAAVVTEEVPLDVEVEPELAPYEPEEVAAAAGAIPRWLAALFVIVPAFALGYALFLPNGPNCGDAGSLAIDPVSGLAVGCDGAPYGSEEVDLFALGADTYEGVGCVACHGASGEGVASFPAFTGGELLSTFPEDSCSAQIEWIGLGTSGWPDPTYGATDKAVGGSGAVMPGFTGVLSPEEIAAVALYERVAFGGQDLEAAQSDCTPPSAESVASGE